MRLGILTAGALSMLLSTPALANTLNFGTAFNNSTCTLAGNAGDRSCTSSVAINNGANDNTAAFEIRAQASADQGLTTDPTAIADITVSYDIPYTVTRTVSSTGNVGEASVPLQTITFTILTKGDVAKDNSQATGGLGNAVAYSGQIQSLGLRFVTQTLNIGASQLGGGGVASTDINTSNGMNVVGGPNSSGPAVGEISFAIQVPTDYRMWSDFLPPAAIDYNNPWSVTQSLTDTLRISFRLRTESRASGSISTTGGEAIACVGQTSPLGSFALDNNAAVNCQNGVQGSGTVTTTGSQLVTVSVPEPSTLMLIGLGVAGLACVGRRKLG